MDDLIIVLQGILKVIKYFFPAIFFFIGGLTYISFNERRDKPKKRPSSGN